MNKDIILGVLIGVVATLLISGAIGMYLGL